MKVSKNIRILLNNKLQDITPVANFKTLVATCGDWRQGWTPLSLKICISGYSRAKLTNSFEYKNVLQWKFFFLNSVSFHWKDQNETSFVFTLYCGFYLFSVHYFRLKLVVCQYYQQYISVWNFDFILKFWKQKLRKLYFFKMSTFQNL